MPPDRKLPEALRPGAHEHGLASGDLDALGSAMNRGWMLFGALAADADLDAPARPAGWSGRDVVARTGSWPFSRGIADLLADAAAGEAGVRDSDALDDVVRAGIVGLDDQEILDSVEQAAAETAAWLATEGPATWGLVPTSSPLGPLPLLTVLHAMNFQLAVASLDLEPCGVAPCAELLDLGLVALLDTVGALAARAGVTGTFTAHTPEHTLGVGAQNRRWRTSDLPPGVRLGPGIEVGVRDLIDLTSGHGSPASLLRSGELRVHDLPGTLRLAPALEGVAGIPPIGPNALGRAIHVVDAVGGVLGRFRR